MVLVINIYMSPVALTKIVKSSDKPRLKSVNQQLNWRTGLTTTQSKILDIFNPKNVIIFCVFFFFDMM